MFDYPVTLTPNDSTVLVTFLPTFLRQSPSVRIMTDLQIKYRAIDALISYVSGHFSSTIS